MYGAEQEERQVASRQEKIREQEQMSQRETISSEQSQSAQRVTEQEESPQEQSEKQRRISAEQKEEEQQAMEETRKKQTMAGSMEVLEKFFSLFPNPEDPQFQLLPNLNKTISLMYEETLRVPPLIFTAIKRLYALIQALTLEESNIHLKELSQQQQIELNNQILQRCIDSQLWQEYNKKFAVDSLEYGMSLLKSIHQEEKIIFTYIPNFETAYYSKGYTDIRNGAELVRLSLVLSDNMRERSIQQTNWAKINTVDELYGAMEQYRESQLYNLSQKIQTLLKSSRKYPFPQGAAIINHNGQIAPAFNHFLYREPNGRLTVSEYAQFIMNVDKNNQPYLTPFGNFIFSYNSNESGPYLAKNPVFHDLFTETENGLMPQPLFLRMLAFDAIRFLNAHMAYLFTAENLEPTMQKLVSLEQRNPGFLQQFPNILPYIPADYPYLEGIREMMPLVADSPGSQSQQQPSVQSWDSFWHSVGNAFKTAADAIAKTAVSAWANIKKAGKAFGEDLADGIGDFFKGTGYFFAAAALAIADPKDGAKFFQRSFSEFSNMGNDLAQTVDQVGNIVKAGLSVADSIVGQGLGIIIDDESFAKDTSGLLDALGDGLVDSLDDLTNYTIEGTFDTFRLTAEAMVVVESLVMAAVTAGQGGTWSAFKSEGDYFAKDVVSSILSEVTFLTDAVGAVLSALMKSVAYLCDAIVALIGDVIADVVALAIDMVGGNGLSVYNKIKNGVHRWRRTIIGGLLLVVGIAITVGSFGSLAELSIPMAIAAGTMMAAGTGMMVIGTMGDVQQDIAAHKKQKQQDAILAAYKQGIPAQENAAKAVQEASLIEATVQFATEKQNSERGLVYYQNFLNQEFNATISTQSMALGNFYQKITMPDPYTAVESSDPGQLYGIKTSRMALNPAGGIYSFNVARNTFAQETATTPKQTLKTTQNSLFTTSPASTGFWLNQKDLSNVWGPDGLEVEVRFRTIYETEGNFYVGIFMSEQVMDIPLLHALNKNYKDALELSGPNAGQYVDKTWENLDTFNRNLLNYNTLSRSLVIFKEYGAPPSLGFYQHQGEGDGWLNRNIEGVTYQRGVWYRMKMKVQEQTTQVKCWEEATNEPYGWVTFQTPQAKRLPVIEPIQLPNDADPFELIVTKPAKKQQQAPPTTQRPIDENHQQDQSSRTGAWRVGRTQNGQPQTQGWRVTRRQESVPETGTWKVKEVIDVQPKVVAWTISGKEQQSQSRKISEAFGSMGVISSGVAVEYQILSPATRLEVAGPRKKENQQVINSFKQQGIELNEKDREHKWLLEHGTAPPQQQGQEQQQNNFQPQGDPGQTPQEGLDQGDPGQPPQEGPNQDDQGKPQHQAPAHSTFWYLQHGQTPPSQSNINSKISSDGKFAIMGGPS